MTRSAWKTAGRMSVWAIAAMGMLAWAVSVAWAQPAGGGAMPEKLKRQIDVMETIIDKVLVNSDNFLVAGLHPVHGLYLPGYGAIFSFEASATGGLRFFGDNLIIQDMPDMPDLPEIPDIGSRLRDIRVETNKDGTVTIIRKKTQDDDEDEDEDEDVDEDDDEDEDEGGKNVEVRIMRAPGADGEWGAQWKEKQAEAAERKAERLEKGRQELMDLLMDYGDTLTRLADEEWVVIAAFFPGDVSVGDEEEGITRLVLRARMGDLRAFGQERISRDAMPARIIEERY
ncbi:MAG: hypothetical protein KBD56_04000 [Candidatus Eisenbacteria bacterium]|nr:hypothetical protein [Candidatus Eisenbacteria bacterium]